MSDDERSEAATPRLRPRDAATLLIFDLTAGKPRILVGKRHDRHVFMPGKVVFPGGRLERSDRLMSSTGTLAPDIAMSLDRCVARRAIGLGRALALAAIRETYEETGLLVGRPTAPFTAPGAWRTFGDAGIMPDLTDLRFIGRAITPPGRRRRYDARFFAVDRSAVAAERPGFVGPDKELVELVWVEFEAARALDLPAVTRAMLGTLEDEIAGRSSPGRPFLRFRSGRYVQDAL